jgi:hypothetical protein
MLLVVVPLGFLLVAGVAAWQAGQWTDASTLFAGLGLLAFCVGVPFASRAAGARAPSRSRIRRFAEDYLRWYPATTATDLRAILRYRFGGSAPMDHLVKSALDQASYGTAYGKGCMAALLMAPIIGIRHRFFPKAPANPADIDAVLTELQEEGRFALDSESKPAEQFSRPPDLNKNEHPDTA